MDKKRKMLPFTLWLIAAVIAGLAVLSLVSAQAEEKQGKTMEENMHKSMKMCVKDCQTNMEDILAASAAIKAAVEAIDKGDTQAAKSELEKAEELLSKVHKSMEENVEKMPCVNARCPISGKSIDMMNRPKELTRMYNGMKIGFCCPACPPEWDKLTDGEREAKLKASKE